MAPTNAPSSGAAITSLSPRSQLHVVIAISILLGFVYSFRRRSKAGLLHAPIPSKASSPQNENLKSPIRVESTRSPSNSTSTSRCYVQSPLPPPTLSQEDAVGPEHENTPSGIERRREATAPYSLDPELSVPSQPHEWHQVRTTEHHFPSKYAPQSASARASFPQLHKETVQDFRSFPNSKQTCRRKILEFR